MYERAMSDIYPPHPEVESARAVMVTKLRVRYEETCHTREGGLVVTPLLTPARSSLLLFY